MVTFSVRATPFFGLSHDHISACLWNWAVNMVCKMISIVELSWAETGFKAISQLVNEIIDHTHFSFSHTLGFIKFYHISASILSWEVILGTRIISNYVLGGVGVSFKAISLLVNQIITINFIFSSRAPILAIILCHISASIWSWEVILGTQVIRNHTLGSIDKGISPKS